MADSAGGHSPAYEIDAVVAGAGAVGLACAAALARAGLEVLVIEAADAIGTGSSSRNSEVVHAGIYYPTGSLKHRLCVAGRRMLYQYMAARGVAHAKCGKLIVATQASELSQIETLAGRAWANGVENLRLIDGAKARALEPQLNAIAAVLSCETGVMDSHGLMLALVGEIEDHGGAISFATPILGGELRPGGGVALRTGGAEPAILNAALFVNAAGHGALTLAHAIEGYPAHLIPKGFLAKGSYFGCAGKPAFSHLIYPAPVDGGLGVHLTLDLAGRMRFGPDVEWLDHADPARVDYSVDIARAAGFYAAIRAYWPGLPDGALTPDYAGLRPKISGPGQTAADFRIDGPELHGHPGLVHLFGIESPGLTSCLALAAEVSARLDVSSKPLMEA
jgi:L-2-hydroxyglutarate oxidase LhgO